MKKNILILALFLASIVPAASMARGFYAAVDAGQSSFDNYCQGQLPGVSCSKTSTAARIGGGFQVSPYFGVEANYGDLGSSKLSGSYGGLPVSGEGKLTTTQVAIVLAVPLSDSWSVRGKLGWARATLEATSNEGSSTGVMLHITTYSFSPTYGFGVQYDLSERFAVRAQYEVFDKISDYLTVSLLSVGAVLKF